MFVLQHWEFLEDIWNFNKIFGKFCCQSDKYEKCRREKLLFKKNHERSKKKESNLFLSILLPWSTSFKVTFPGITSTSSSTSSSSSSSSSRAIQVYFTGYSECMTWTRLLMHIWTLNYTLKTGCTWNSKYKNLLQNTWKNQVQTYWENAHIRSVSFWKPIVALNQVY